MEITPKSGIKQRDGWLENCGVRCRHLTRRWCKPMAGDSTELCIATNRLRLRLRHAVPLPGQAGCRLTLEPADGDQQTLECGPRTRRPPRADTERICGIARGGTGYGGIATMPASSPWSLMRAHNSIAGEYVRCSGSSRRGAVPTPKGVEASKNT